MKITYRSGDSGNKPENLLHQFRTNYPTHIAVTVDMIATGTDVKPIECVVFMRMVRSRNFFEQMKGRGVRVIDSNDLQAVTPDAKVKDRFVTVDAVGVTDAGLHDTVPLERKKGVGFDRLLNQIGLGSTDEAAVSSVAFSHTTRPLRGSPTAIVTPLAVGSLASRGMGFEGSHVLEVPDPWRLESKGSDVGDHHLCLVQRV